MATKLQATISLLDPNKRYIIEWGLEGEPAYQTRGYVTQRELSFIEVYATDDSFLPTVVGTPFIRKISHANKRDGGVIWEARQS